MLGTPTIRTMSFSSDTLDSEEEADYKACPKEGKQTFGGAQIKTGAEAVMPEESEVVFVKDNVSVHPTQNASQRINGRLKLLKQGSALFMTWIPNSQRSLLVKEGSFASTGQGKNTSDRDRNLYTIRAVSLKEIRSIRRHTPPFGWQYIIIVLVSGLAFPPLYFHNGGIKEFLATLKEYVHIVRSAEDANLYLLNDVSQDPLQRSLSSLELRDVLPVATAAPSVSTIENSEALSEKPEVNQTSAELGYMSNVLEASDPIRRPNWDVSIAVLEKFSLVTKFARDTTAQLFGESRLLSGSDREEMMQAFASSMEEERCKPLSLQQSSSSSSERSESSSQKLGGGRDASGEASTNVGIFEIVDVAQRAGSSMVWGRPRLPPLGSDEWATFLENEGRVMDSKALRKRVFYGGIEHSLRCEVWKFLLGYYSYDSTYKEREKLSDRKKVEYNILKSQWMTVSEQQSKRFSKFRERKSRIEKDVVRTDRGLSFYEGDENPNVRILRDILLTYSFYNFDLGYCQGMSDLLSPILFVMEDEPDSFWCFAALMERLAPNFHRDQNGMHSQLLELSKLVQLLDSPLHNYLKQADCLNYFFCFRWILIQFKREFDYESVMRLWEVLWTYFLSEHFHLYMCVAILKRYRRKIIGEQMDFDTLLKFINELSQHIDLEATLQDAEALCIIANDLGVTSIPPRTPPSLPTS